MTDRSGTKMKHLCTWHRSLDLETNSSKDDENVEEPVARIQMQCRNQTDWPCQASFTSSMVESASFFSRTTSRIHLWGWYVTGYPLTKPTNLCPQCAGLMIWTLSHHEQGAILLHVKGVQESRHMQRVLTPQCTGTTGTPRINLSCVLMSLDHQALL